jgi:hypothetical protein
VLVYSQVTYSVRFSESGLPSGLLWQLTVNGEVGSLTTNGATDSLTWTGLANGSYAYSIADSSGWHQSTLAYGGNVAVDGAAAIEPTLVYSRVTYSVTFSESGLPSGLTWKVKVAGITMSLKTNGGTDDLTWNGMANGSYAYAIFAIPGWIQTTLPHSGHVPVDGGSVSEVTLTYTQMMYSVTFHESGLPTGTLWSVTLNGKKETSTGTAIVFSEPNGTYGYTIGTVSGYNPAHSSGSATVDGSAESKTVKFARVG